MRRWLTLMPDDLKRPIVFLYGGLGNQLFQIAKALDFETRSIRVNISQINGIFELENFLKFLANKRNIQITVESDKPSFFLTKAHNYLLRSTQWQKTRKIQVFLIRLSIKFVFALCGSGKSWLYSDDVHLNFLPGKKFNFDQLKVIGYFQSEATARTIRKDLISFLNLNYPETMILEDTDVSSSLTIHVRRGDYATEEKIGMLSILYFMHSIKFVLKKYSPSKLYFFSNGIVDAQVFIKGTDIDSLVEVNATSTLELLAKMRQGEVFLISNSTLSWWAAYICENPEKQVFVPFPWFRKLPEPVNFIPIDWNRLPAIWSRGNNN
jgi:hypothetical protein